MSKIKIAAILQIAFFAGWALFLAINDSRIDAEFWLETLPVDPRDYLSGNYVQLDYSIERPEDESCKAFDRWTHNGKPLSVKLLPGKEITLSDGTAVTTYYAAACMEGKTGFINDTDDRAIWIQAKGAHRANRRINGYLFYENLNRYYMNEKDERLNIRSGKAAVQVRKNKNGNLRIIRLEEIKQPE